MVDIVQLVERQIVDLVVQGSSPCIHPTYTKKVNLVYLFYFLTDSTRTLTYGIRDPADFVATRNIWLSAI